MEIRLGARNRLYCPVIGCNGYVFWSELHKANRCSQCDKEMNNDEVMQRLKERAEIRKERNS